MMTLLVVLLVVLILAVSLVAGLLFMRQRRRARKAQMLPLYDEKRASIASTASINSHHRRVMVRPSESVYFYQEKQKLVEDHSSPDEKLPEIRITFPEEFDDSGKRQSGRVVVVRVGDTTVGLEPVADEKLPAYGNDERFQSLDLERIGGLVEKTQNAPSKEYS